MPAVPPPSSPFWAPHVHADRRPILLARGRIVAALRAWFAGQDFVEVDTAALQVSPGNEIHLHAFATTLVAPDGTASPRYLRTSPEFACKKLLAAGEPRIVEFAKVFRNRERGALHHPEFTLVEWYRAGESYETLMGDCVAILRAAARAAGTRQLTFRGRSADAFAEPERLDRCGSLRPLCRHRSAGDAAGRRAGPRRASLAPRRRRASASPMTTPGAIFSAACWWSGSRAISASAAPPFSIEYPAALSALARPAQGSTKIRASPSASSFTSAASSSPTALANSTTPPSSAAGSNAKWRRKQRIYGERYPIDEDFIAALAQMPQACGIALGLDRLVMLATGASRIDQVLWTPIQE